MKEYENNNKDFIKEENGFIFAEIDFAQLTKKRPYQCRECGFLDYDRKSVCPACGKNREDRISSIIHDPVEYSKKYKEIEPEIEAIILTKFPRRERNLGDCHLIWQFKQKLLRDKYGIIWHKPTELNPHICFD